MQDDDYRKLDSLHSVALREAWLWSLAVQRLCDSIESSMDGLRSQVDAMLLSVAYRNVYRGVRMAIDYRPEGAAKGLMSALVQADELAAGALDVRDRLEHFDSYEAGMGDTQQPSTPRRKREADETLAREHLIYFRRDPDFALVVGDAELHVGSVRRATRLLIEALHTYG